MFIGAGNPSVVAYTNHWTPVQMYYAVYLALRALFEAARMTVGEQHAKTLHAIGGEIKSRPALFPYPWKLLCVGAGARQCEYLHLPTGVTIDPVSSLRFDAPTWDSIGMLLRTTRDRQIERVTDVWKRENKRQRIAASTKRMLAMKLPPTSLFDAMYRLRIRSNYEDADAFLTALPSDGEAITFSKAMRRVCWFTMLLLETLTAKYIGRAAFGQCVSSFEARDIGRCSNCLSDVAGRRSSRDSHSGLDKSGGCADKSLNPGLQPVAARDRAPKVKKQEAFLLAKTPEQRRQWDALLNKLVDAKQLDYAVLMAHVLVYDDLRHLLGLRLRTDTLPERLPMFDVLTGLALAGSRFAKDRETLGFLNSARNEVAHETNRSKFEDAARQFAYRSCNDDNPDYRITFEWPAEEEKRVENFCFGIFVWQAKLGELHTEFDPEISSGPAVC
jgi:hypothetical protein